MADILIKNMEMPKTCFDCPFLRDDFCIVLGYEMRNDQILMGCGSCPLLEVRPHKDLIDRDELLSDIKGRSEAGRLDYNDPTAVVSMILSAQTVLEASE